MPNYFANGCRFRAYKNQSGIQTLNSISGVLKDYFEKTSYNSSRCWFIIRLKNKEVTFDAYFEPKKISENISNDLKSSRNKKIRLSCENGVPVINEGGDEPEEVIRNELLKGVAAGTINVEDLPALLEFYKGNDTLYEQWQVFKQQLDYKGLVKTKEEIGQRTTELQNVIDQEKDKLYQLDVIYDEVKEKRRKLLRELNEALVLIQGENYPQGSGRSGLNGIGTENLVKIDTGYNKLLQAIEKFRTQKEIFVICGNKIHKIHHAYLEEKGRIFLLGSAQEFNRRAQEESRKIVDKILHLLHPDYHPAK